MEKENKIDFLNTSLYWLLLGCNLGYLSNLWLYLSDPNLPHAPDKVSQIFFLFVLLIQIFFVLVSFFVKKGFVRYVIYAINIMMLVYFIGQDIFYRII